MLFENNIYKMLKPGGRLIISTLYHGYFRNVTLAITGKLENHFTALWDGGHIIFCSYNTIKELLSEFSFIGVGRFPYLLKSMVISAKKSHL